MTNTPTQSKFISFINTHRNCRYVNNYALLQMTTKMMIACLLYMICFFIHVYLITRVSRGHLNNNFIFIVLFYHRLRFGMICTWSWILCHLSLLCFVVLWPLIWCSSATVHFKAKHLSWGLFCNIRPGGNKRNNRRCYTANWTINCYLPWIKNAGGGNKWPIPFFFQWMGGGGDLCKLVLG